MAIAGLAAAGTSVMNKGIDFMSAGLANDESFDKTSRLMDKQNYVQRGNNLRAMTDKRQSLERAGINLNAENGFQPANTVPSASFTAQRSDSPLFDYNALNAGTNAVVGESQAKKNYSDVDVNDANIYKIGEEVQKILMDIRGQELSNEYQELVNKWYDMVTQSQVSLNWSEVAYNDFKSLTEEAQQTVIPAMVKKIYSEVTLNKASSKNQLAQAKNAIASALYTDEQRKHYESYIDSVIKNNKALAGKTDAEKDILATQLLIYGKDLSWYEFNQVLKLIETGVDVAEAVSSFVPFGGSRTKGETGSGSSGTSWSRSRFR